MNATQLKEELEQFYGTTKYHRLNLLPVLATDGVAYFCKEAKAYWLFDDMSAFAMENLTTYFIVAIVRVKDHIGTITYESGNCEKLGEKHYDYTSLPSGEWKFFISNYPTEKVIMLPSEN